MTLKVKQNMLQLKIFSYTCPELHQMRQLLFLRFQMLSMRKTLPLFPKRCQIKVVNETREHFNLDSHLPNKFVSFDAMNAL